MADAEQAYVQARLPGTETWICLPPEAREGRKRGKFERLVVRLALALYGHPDSGTCWEKTLRRSRRQGWGQAHLRGMVIVLLP